MSRQILSHERLISLFDYQKTTGLFIRKISTSSRTPVGQIVGNYAGAGYLTVLIDGGRYYLHRLAWMFIYGSWPEGEIDHINGDKEDNRIANLRVVTRQQNQHNHGVRRDNTSGYTGVKRGSSAVNPWTARIYVGGREVSLGSFPNPEQASAAYLAAKRIHHPTAPL